MILDALPLRPALDVSAQSRWRIARKQAVPIRPPAFLEGPEARLATLREQYETTQLVIPETHGYVLSDVSVVGENAIVFSDGTFIDSSLIADADRPIRRHFVSDVLPHRGSIYESQWLDNEGPKIEEPALFLGSAGIDMYHHWLFDAVTKLAIINPEAFPHVYYAVPDNVPTQMLEWLDAFGVEEHRVIRTKVDVRTRFDRLILLPRLATAEVMLPDVLEKLRSVAGSSGGQSSPSHRRAFIARSDTPTHSRQLLNEAGIANEFAKLGYAVLTPGSWGPLEQARIFAQADRIVAVHGSGAANVLFSPTGARIMHLQPVEVGGFRQHGQVSALRDQVFGYVFGETFSRDARFHNVEWVIDWRAVRRIIELYEF